MKIDFGKWLTGCAVLCVLGASAVAQASSPWEDLDAFETGRVTQNTNSSLKPRAEETAFGNWYAGLHAGGVIVPDIEFVGSGLEMDVAFDTGFGFGGSFGYAYDFGLRIESELTYRVTQAKGFDISGVPFPGSGNIDTLNVMLNGWFDINFLSALFGDWVPYFGVGAGVSHAWTNVGWKGFPIVEAEDTVFAWQGGGGLAYKISDSLFLTADYRFFRTLGSFEFEDPFYVDPIKAEYKTHNITVGFRGHF